ncbi:DUF3348 domain-containing protein [Janthinobacterium sp. 17J80-10]|uniref:DUF3348 domain-containing protein n=1 Tax=Janthinobacterium sp. 17J80-10 TaxID=2497863 RepID=UPI001005A7B1|nr:DUF3348 domain-containing protein [Janthinobacterium sp. 17J80-10]QAU32951.1 DUF3348 domain-containing protein [Janthinobacterium sp. 17J80-10]
MTRTLPRTKFHSSNLIRCLASLDMVDAADAGTAFAEKLGQWIHFADAITLSGVHNGSVASSPKTQSTVRHEEHLAAHAAATEFDRIQANLVDSIMKSCSPVPGRTHNKLPEPQLELPMNFAAAYTPYRRFYEAHQRDMELRIQPLRFNVRSAVAKASPRLKKLAELDATLEKILQEREAHLLAKVPGLLRKRFEQLFKEHQQKLADVQQIDNPAAWAQAGGWLARFCNDMQMLLLAEVELRLQPAMGLIEAFKQDTQ